MSIDDFDEGELALGVLAAAAAVCGLGLVAYSGLASRPDNCLSPYVQHRITSRPAKIVVKHVKKKPLEEYLAKTQLEKAPIKPVAKEDPYMHLPIERLLNISFGDYAETKGNSKRSYIAKGIHGCLTADAGKDYILAPAKTEAIVNFVHTSERCGYGTALIPRGK